MGTKTAKIMKGYAEFGVDLAKGPTQRTGTKTARSMKRFADSIARSSKRFARLK